eukprot:44572_1
MAEDGSCGFEQFLLGYDVSKQAIQKLIDNGLKTINHLKEIEMEDISDICKECGIKTVQKVKLKAAIKHSQILDLPPVIIDKQERLALTQMTNKIKDIEEIIALISETSKNIDEEVINDTNRIKTTFKEIHELLDKRESKLIETLHKMVNKKKQKLQIEKNTLNQKCVQSKQKLNECS